MKGIIISLSAILALSLLVWLFGATTTSHLSEIAELVSEGRDEKSREKIAEAKELFEKREPLLSLAVPDDTLCLIYTELCESVSIIDSDDEGAALGMINRLVAEIEQAGRLNGLCFFAIF